MFCTVLRYLVIAVKGTNVHTGAVVRAKLNLIDLAGSERISKTDATGERLRCCAVVCLLCCVKEIKP